MTYVLAIAAVLVVVDQVTKAWARDVLTLGVPVPVFDGWLNLTLVMNPGLAFGLLGSVPPGWRWLIACMSVVALAVLARVALRILPDGGWTGLLAVALIFGGPSEI